MLKKLFYAFSCSLLFGYSLAEIENSDAEIENSDREAENSSTKFDGFLNMKTCHERDNQYPFGPKNSSAFGLNPVFAIGNFTIEGDFYYGRQFTFIQPLKGARNLSRITGYENRAVFYNGFSQFKNDLVSPMENALDKAHFYRSYTRGTYTNNSHNFRVVIGDTVSRNTIGFQNPLSGAGIGIFRQSGNGEVINSGLPIVITRVSRIECKMGDDIIALQIFKPGVYSIADLPEEAKLPGVTVKIKDQLDRSETLKVDYFSGYEMPKIGEDDFDVTVVCDHKWDIEDPHKIKYQNKPRYSANYRYGYTDNITVGAGVQAHKSSYIIDSVVIFSNELGKFSPNIAFSDARSDTGSKKAAGAGFFYAIPKNDLGIFFEAFFAAKGKGFGDLGKGNEIENAYNDFMSKYFSAANANLVDRFKNSSTETSSRQITTRLYTKPIWNITPAFVFNGEWSNSKRLREYTLSLTTKIFDCCSFTLSGGLTYDDPHKGRNLESPDRRLVAACCIDIGTEFSLKGSFSHYDDEKKRSFCSISYTPDEVKGLELCAERSSRPGLANPCFSVKYDGEFFNAKAEETIINKYKDAESGTSSDSHTNRQRFYFGTSLSRDGFKSERKSGFNILSGIGK